MSELPRWVTTTEAARLLGLKARKTVWLWIKKGAIPDQFLLRVGSHTKIDRSFCVGSK